MAEHFVIDGSNLATEGRTEPSLAQLRAAVNAFGEEHPGAVTTVVVDASFEHRIDPSERAAFSKIESEGHVVSPPAGAVGRGDGFLLQIANRTGGTVVSNDSFQEFHAEYEWLFEPGRLIGAKPVPGVGWIFSLRRPVRGIVSRKTVQKAKKETKAEQQVRKAIAEATEDAMESGTPKRRRRRGGRGRSSPAPAEPEAVNEPAPFLQFVIDHRLGTEAEGKVDAFASHGAFVIIDGVRCYVPLSALGDPPPTRARDVLTRGEQRTFVIQAVDAPRRGIELGLPGFATVAGAPSDETVAAELRRGKASRPTKKTAPPKSAPKKSTPEKPAKKRPPKKDANESAADPQALKTPAQKTAAQKIPAKKVPAQNPPAAKKATAQKATAQSRPAGKKTAVQKAAPKKAPVQKAAPKQTAGKQAPVHKPAVKRTAAKKTAAKTAANPRTAKKTTPARKTPAEETPSQETSAKKTSAKKRTRAQKAPATKATAKKAPKQGSRRR